MLEAPTCVSLMGTIVQIYVSFHLTPQTFPCVTDTPLAPVQTAPLTYARTRIRLVLEFFYQIEIWSRLQLTPPLSVNFLYVYDNPPQVCANYLNDPFY